MLHTYIPSKNTAVCVYSIHMYSTIKPEKESDFRLLTSSNIDTQPVDCTYVPVSSHVHCVHAVLDSNYCQRPTYNSSTYVKIIHIIHSFIAQFSMFPMSFAARGLSCALTVGQIQGTEVLRQLA